MSLYKRLHEVQQGPAATGQAKRRDPVLDELRQRMFLERADDARSDVRERTDVEHGPAARELRD